MEDHQLKRVLGCRNTVNFEGSRSKKTERKDGSLLLVMINSEEKTYACLGNEGKGL